MLNFIKTLICFRLSTTTINGLVCTDKRHTFDVLVYNCLYPHGVVQTLAKVLVFEHAIQQYLPVCFVVLINPVKHYVRIVCNLKQGKP